MGMHSSDDSRFMASVKVGPKGQVVIPKEVREMFGIQPGDSLILLADQDKGIALQRMSVFSAIADAIFAGRAKDIYPEQTEAASRTFAQAVKEVAANPEEEEP